MFCKYCGKEINDQAVVCVHCGRAVHSEQEINQSAGQSKKGLGVLLGIFFGLIGLIVGICLYNENSIERKTFINGWIIGFVGSIAVSIIIGVFYGCLIALSI